MSQKQILAYVIACALFGYPLGYALGASKVLLFDSTSDGKFATVRVCDINPEYQNENNGCMNHNKTTTTLKRASEISGKTWGSIGLAFGAFVGFYIAGKVSEKKPNFDKG